MIIPAEIIRINKQLHDLYGEEDNKPRWRVVWSGDELENRYGDYEDRTVEGILIRRISEWRQVPKYRQYMDDQWILERLLVMPSFETPTANRLSYECLWAFGDKAPIWPAVRLVADTVYHNMKQAGRTRYKDPDSEPAAAEFNKEERIKEYEELLFGNETETTDALAYKQGVGYTGKSKGS